jgi:hypothetical protein
LSSPFLIFVDGKPVQATAGQTTLDAIAAWQPELAGLLGNTRRLADSRGLPIDPGLPAYAGAIFRVVSAGRPGSSDETAHGMSPE